MSKLDRQRITAHDVAARAGVSQPTVSLVLSGNPSARVAKNTRVRVLQAARELGYQPNLLARGLVQRRSFALGVIVPNLDNPFFTQVVSGAEQVAAEEGYAVLLCDAQRTSIERHIETLRSRMVEGVILTAGGAHLPPEQLLMGLDAVLIDEPSTRWPAVASDAAQAGRLAATLLLELGHLRIAFIGPATDSHTFRMRERGFTALLRERGIALPSALLRRSPASVAGGQEAMRAIIANRGAAAPTALFCASDLIALGALKACLSAGMNVPRDISIVGCDDIEMARIVTPELTTVRVPARELGARAARLLVRRLDREGLAKTEDSSRRLLPVRLIVRGTTAAAPNEGVRA